MSSSIIRLGLIQMAMVAEPRKNVARAEALIAEAAGQGAQIIALPELFNTQYFCRTQDVERFDLAEPIPGPSTNKLQRLAKKLGVVIIAPVFERRAAGVYHNSAVIFDADGTQLGVYRKMHIPQDPGFEEKFYFTPGDNGFRAWDTAFGRIGVCICWDQWYPEAARLTALNGAEILFYPTAIGWLPEEKDSLGPAQFNAWDTVQRGHAVANGCFVAAINRVGTEGEGDRPDLGDTEFWRQSFVADPYGRRVAQASLSDEQVLLHDCDLAALEDFRRIWPFFRDRRVDAYHGLMKRYIDLR